MDIESYLKLLVEAIKKVIKPKKIFLFGSYAYGKPNEESDIDICILTEEKCDELEKTFEIQKLLYDKIDLPIDVLIYEEKRFNYRSDSISTIEKTIKNRGRLLYG